MKIYYRIILGLFWVLFMVCCGRGVAAQAAEPEAEVLIKERTKKGSTELFHYQITADNELIITGLTETAETEKKNRILTIPETIDNVSVAGIAEGAFAGVPLTSVTLPEGLLEIGRGAFYGCNLHEIVIPASVCYIGPRAFGANYSMQKILVSEENQIYSSRTGVLYDKEKTILLQMPSNLTGPKFTVSKSVNTIGEYAFGNCKNVTRVYGDETALEIREMAFWNTPAAMKKKTVVGDTSGSEFYAMHTLDYVESYGVSHQLNDNNSLSIQYKEKNGELLYTLYESVELRNCSEIVLRIRNEVGDIAIKFYDDEFNVVETFYLEKAAGDRTFSFTPSYKGKVVYIGFMADDYELTDYSAFETVVYSAEFRFICMEGEEVTYRVDELPHWQSYFLNYMRDSDGSIFIKYNQLYGAMILHLPEELDMSKCAGIKVKMKNEVGDLAVKLFDNAMNEVDVFYGIRTTGVQEKELVPTTKEKVTGIGFMTCDNDLTEYSMCETTIYSVTFYMQQGYEGE